MRPKIWTQSLRKIMYRRLLKKFGPHSSWGMHAHPANKEDQYNLAVEKLASTFTKVVGRKITPDAVKQQIDWAKTRQRVLRSKSAIQNLILNKAAALDVEFISTSDLPKDMFLHF